MRIYLASSWRNDRQPEVLAQLRRAGHEVYDFRHPRDGEHGFHWSDIAAAWQTWTAAEFAHSLEHPIAEAGFASDWNAMEWADACVCLLPCGRSAHLEAGWFVGAKKPLIFLLSNGEPELMYKMATAVRTSINGVLQSLVDLRGLHD